MVEPDPCLRRGVNYIRPLTGPVTPIDPDNDRIRSPIQVGPKPNDLAVGLGAVWVADQADDSVYRIDPLTHNVERIQVGGPIASVVVDEANRSLWVAVAAPETEG